MGPSEAVLLIVACGVTICAINQVILRDKLDTSRLVPFLAGGAFGVPVGAWLLRFAKPEPFRLGMGIFLVAYGGVFMILRALPAVTAGGRAADAAVGLAGGVLGGFAGLSGVLPTIWSGLRAWPKARQRGTYQPYVLTMHGLALVSLAVAGLVDVKMGERYLWFLPALLVGTWVGLKLYGHLNEVWFQRLVLGLFFVSGVALIVGAVGAGS